VPYGTAFFIQFAKFKESNMSKTLEQIQDEHFSDTKLVEIKDAVEIEKMLTSKTSSCWGAGEKIGDDWVQLFSPSRQSPNDKLIVSVCLLRNVPNHLVHLIRG
jgi:hypothetical protein